jgi:hypothetical protein
MNSAPQQHEQRRGRVCRVRCDAATLSTLLTGTCQCGVRVLTWWCVLARLLLLRATVGWCDAPSGGDDEHRLKRPAAGRPPEMRPAALATNHAIVQRGSPLTRRPTSTAAPATRSRAASSAAATAIRRSFWQPWTRRRALLATSTLLVAAAGQQQRRTHTGESEGNVARRCMRSSLHDCIHRRFGEAENLGPSVS